MPMSLVREFELEGVAQAVLALAIHKVLRLVEAGAHKLRYSDWLALGHHHGAATEGDGGVEGGVRLPRSLQCESR